MNGVGQLYLDNTDVAVMCNKVESVKYGIKQSVSVKKVSKFKSLPEMNRYMKKLCTMQQDYYGGEVVPYYTFTALIHVPTLK